MAALRERLLAAPLAPGVSSAPPDRIVIVAGCRTAFCKSKRGALRDVHANELLAAVLRECCVRAGIDPSEVDDVVCGSVLQPGGGAIMARMAALQAGQRMHTSVATVNRQCGSSLEAIAVVADRIRSGAVAVGIGCGVESMTHTEMKTAAPVVSWAAVRACSAALSCTLPMGVTSDNLARMFGIRRQAQDCFAAESHRRAAASTGALSREIVAVGGVTADDGVRGDCSPEALATLTPAFTQEGTTTAGNASQVSDGAAAVLLASESVARALGAPVLGVWLAYCAVGVDPSLMGIGPAAAIPRALRLAGLEVGDVDVFEINEAFASQCLYCIDSLGIPREKVNPRGGAIALGHPLGATGARLVLTALLYLKERGLRYGVVSLCVGTGMGVAAVLENPSYRARSRL